MQRAPSTALLVTAFLLLPALSLAEVPTGPPRVSPMATVSQVVGVSEVTIVYSRPGVNERTIWGELVPWDEVWRTGANEATTITFTDAVKINGKELAAGSYGLFAFMAGRFLYPAAPPRSAPSAGCTTARHRSRSTRTSAWSAWAATTRRVWSSTGWGSLRPCRTGRPRA